MYRDAEAAGVWVNVADDPARCSFVLPAVSRDGPVSVAVSTGGASPALAGWLRDRAADALGPGLGDLAACSTRPDGVSRAGRSTETRRLARCSTGRCPLVRQGRMDEARGASTRSSTSRRARRAPTRRRALAAGVRARNAR